MLSHKCRLSGYGIKPARKCTRATKFQREKTYWRSKEVKDHSRTLQQLIRIGVDGLIDETRLIQA